MNNAILNLTGQPSACHSHTDQDHNGSCDCELSKESFGANKCIQV
jgi:hypothetical protein